MQFEYEIRAEEYVAAQVLCYRLSSGRKGVARSVTWILAGAFLLVVAWNEQVLSWPTVLLVSIGLWWIFWAVLALFPRWYLHRAYRSTALPGKKFQAEVTEEGFNVRGEFRGWNVRWPGVSLKAEDKHVFMLYTEPTIFMFGKKYLTTGQQVEFRRLAGLSTVD